MELAPRYCRTCSSRILVKNICHNCNHEPLKGENYCYDCGALTPNADRCLKCGAKYKRKSFAKPLLIAALTLVVLSVAGYFILTSDSTQKLSKKEELSPKLNVPKTEPENPVSQTPIINNPVDTTHSAIVIPQDTAKAIINNNKDTAAIKSIAGDSAKQLKTEIETFTSGDIKNYNVRCSYFKKNMRSQVLFFIAAGKGYIKVNGKIYEMIRKHKGVDEAFFTGNEYEAKIIIEGLSGTAQDWLASCTLIVKNIVQKTTIKHTVYSHCIEL